MSPLQAAFAAALLAAVLCAASVPAALAAVASPEALAVAVDDVCDATEGPGCALHALQQTAQREGLSKPAAARQQQRLQLQAPLLPQASVAEVGANVTEDTAEEPEDEDDSVDEEAQVRAMSNRATRLSTVTEEIQRVVNETVERSREVIADAEAAAAQALNVTVAGLPAQVLEGILETSLAFTLANASLAVQQLESSVQDILQPLNETAKVLIPSVEAVVGEAAEKIVAAKDLAANVSSPAELLKQAVYGALETVVVERLNASVAALPPALQEGVREAKAASRKVVDVAEQAAGALQELPAGMRKAVAEAVANQTAAKVAEATGKIAEQVASVAQQLNVTVRLLNASSIDETVQEVTRELEELRNATKEVNTSLRESVDQAVQELESSVQQSVSEAKQAVQEATDSVVENLKKALRKPPLLRDAEGHAAWLRPASLGLAAPLLALVALL